jgi:hypothetical protein
MLELLMFTNKSSRQQQRSFFLQAITRGNQQMQLDTATNKQLLPTPFPTAEEERFCSR